MKTRSTSIKDHLKNVYVRVKELHGDPHYIAMGMAVGVFISVTPTIPFHMLLAIGLAFILKGSKPAAIIGSWFANPITIPFFYVGSYKVGTFILNKPIPFDVKFESLSDLTTLGLDATFAMVVGSAVIGILPTIIAYFITYRIVSTVRVKALARKQLSISEGINEDGAEE